MSIKYKIVKSKPGLINKVQYMSRPVNRGVIDFDKLSNKISKMSTFSRADVRGVFTLLEELIPDYLQDGYSVKLDGVGIFSTSFKCEQKDSPDEVNSKSIKEVRINFRADSKMKKDIRKASFEKTI